MRFQTRYRTASYVIRPAFVEKTPVGQSIPHKGLKADFTGPIVPLGADGKPIGEPFAVPGTFDSVVAQRNLQWSDEDRLAVERGLLTHPDFGNGVYLAHGQSIPSEHADLNLAVEPVADVPAEPDAPVERCMFIRIEEDGKPWQCKRPRTGDSDYCSQHAKKIAEDEAGAGAETVTAQAV